MAPDPIDQDQTQSEAAEAEELRPLTRGTCVGRYLISDVLGQGGMGVVYRAFDPDLGRPVALKMLTVKKLPGQHTDDCRQDRNRLLREAQALAKLSHPNVVTVHDVGTFADSVFIAMELVEGKTLDSWLRTEKPVPAEVINIVMAAGRGLAAAHKAGIIHRDFKPANVIVGEDQRVRVLDFGLARSTDVPQPKWELAAISVDDLPEPEDTSSTSGSVNYLSSSLTQAGTILGTRNYMAPEQFERRPVDERTDQFAFCVVLFEALHDHRPHQGRSNRELVRNMTEGNIDLPKKSVIPDWMMKVVQRGLYAQQDKRYPSMTQLLDDLGNDPFKTLQQIRAKRRKVLTLMAATLVFVLATTFAVWYGATRGSRLCKGADQKISAAWSDGKRVRIKTAFLTGGRAHEQDAFARVENLLDKYRDDWVRMSTEACEAAQLHGTQSLKMMDLRMACLQRRMGEMRALTELFAKAPDPELINKAVQATMSLGKISRCADTESLLAAYPPPEDAKVQAGVEALRKKLDQAGALSRAGKSKEGLTLISSGILDEAQAIAYAPVEAEARLLLGKMQSDIGDTKKAEENLKKAMQIGGLVKDDQLMAAAASELIYVVGYQQGRYAESFEIGTLAKAMVARAGNRPLQLAIVSARSAEIQEKQGKYEEAKRNHLAAIDLLARSYGANHPEIAQIHGKLGNVYYEQGDFEGSKRHHELARAIHKKTLGAHHPNVAIPLLNLGNIAARQGDNQQGQQYFAQALKIWENAYGPNHPMVSRALNNLGLLLARQGKYQESFQHHLRALHIMEDTLGKDNPSLGAVLNNLGGVLVSLERYPESQEYFDRALRLRTAALGVDHPKLCYSYIGLGELNFRQKKYPQAIEYFHKTIQLWAKAFGQNHPFLVSPLTSLGLCLLELDKPKEAKKSFQRVLSICENGKCQGDDSEALAKAQLALAKVQNP